MKQGKIIAIIIVSMLLVFCGSCSKNKQVLYIFNWSDYIDPDLIKEFEQQNKCTIKYSTYDSNENMLTKIMSSREAFDLIFPSGDHVTIMHNAGLLEQLDLTKIPNYQNLDNNLLLKATSFDPGNKYSIPYFWGLTGIIYNQRYVPESIVKSQSWNILADNFFTGKNKVTMLDDAREVVGAALIYNGYDLNDTSDAALAAAEKTLAEWDKNITQFDSDSYKNEVPDGTTWLAQAYNGDALQVMENNPDIKFFLPLEGTSLWMDNIVMLKSSKNKELAYKFIDFLLNSEISKRNTEYCRYATPNKAASNLLSESLKNNTLIYPGEEYLQKCSMINALGENVKKIDKLFEAIKLN
ncbi:MAG TPA: spermidine/putrescine ABC transporter substrate-binding protein [Candidatus Cloacimonas sp.]|nr:spermidine/putrescine ABC transporter substrate-binding protein [Candidatus Cloacimonas sp.]